MRNHLTASASSSGTPAPRGVHEAQAQLRVGETLLGGHAEPLGGFGIVFGHALAGVVHEAQFVLRVGVTLLGSHAEPLDGFGIVFGHAPRRCRT